jgi:hypothetical protein
MKTYTFFEFQKLLQTYNQTLYQFLTEKINLDPNDINHIFDELEIDKNKLTSELSQQQIDKLFRILSEPRITLIQQEVEKAPENLEKVKPRKKWYERYRWFFSSNDILIIAGKTPRNNETIIKRYTKLHDLILHSDIPNSPFVVIRNVQKLNPLPAETIYEAAELVVTYSKAWEENWEKDKCSVYYIAPHQITKESNLPLGEFLITGEKRHLGKIKPRLSIGVKEIENFQVKLIFGPPTAVKKQSPYLVTILPGDTQARDLAEKIKQQLVIKVFPEIKNSTEEIELKDIEKIIPYGKGQLVK